MKQAVGVEEGPSGWCRAHQTWSYMEKLDLTPKNQGRGTDSRAAGGEVGEAFDVSQEEENLGSFRSYS